MIFSENRLPLFGIMLYAAAAVGCGIVSRQAGNAKTRPNQLLMLPYGSIGSCASLL
jgi:hypothetical protein